MYITKKMYIKPDMKLSDFFFDNPYLLLMMEHFNLNFVTHEKTIEDLCNEHSINTNIFVDIANLYNGFNEISAEKYQKNDIPTLINFLKNSHDYYKEEKYPEIRDLICKISTINETAEIKLIKTFFEEYFNEVVEHLDYEDKVAFPYFIDILNKKESIIKQADYSAKVYCDHHTDIESKLMELNNLLLRHIPLGKDSSLRRKLILSLFEMEYELKIHYLLEENALIPLVSNIEKNIK